MMMAPVSPTITRAGDRDVFAGDSMDAAEPDIGGKI